MKAGDAKGGSSGPAGSVMDNPPGETAERRVAFATLGCKVNRADTQRVAEALPGWVRLVPFDERADLYVINTCTVTAVADRQSRQLIARAHRKNPSAPIVVTGCLAELRPEEVSQRAGVIEVVPNGGKPALVSRILDHLPGAPERRAPPDAAATYRYRPREVTRPPLKIQDGCGGECTYCTVAAARGAPLSVPPEEVLGALAAYGAQGCPEVVLAGIDLGSYGQDLSPPGSLAGLIVRAASLAGMPRLRLSSLEVHRVDDALVDTLAAYRHLVCPHLHLPLQSGADPVLARMRRPYDAALFRTRFEALRGAFEGACLGADVIAGFPGESDADHRATVAFVEEMAPAYLHVFPFSPRPGTPAARFGDVVPLAIRKARAAELRALSDRLWLRFREAHEGRETSAVVYFRRTQGRLTAFSEQGIPLVLDGPDDLMGRRVLLRLGQPTEDGMEGGLLLE